MILVSTIFETKVIIATKIRREKKENCVEFSFHSISGFERKLTLGSILKLLPVVVGGNFPIFVVMFPKKVEQEQVAH